MKYKDLFYLKHTSTALSESHETVEFSIICVTDQHEIATLTLGIAEDSIATSLRDYDHSLSLTLAQFSAQVIPIALTLHTAAQPKAFHS